MRMNYAEPATRKLPLTMVLENKPWAAPIISGEITSPAIALDCPGVSVVSREFKPFVRDLQYDCGELSIVTYLQAKSYDKDLALLPFVIAGNFHHHNLVGHAEVELRPQDLRGKRVGVRTYTQTTGVWLRGILEEEYGVDNDAMTWVTSEASHLAEYEDPANCERAPAGSDLRAMFLDGQLDALLGGDMRNDPRVTPVIPDPDTAASHWLDKYGVVPINHMFVVRKSLLRQRPDIVRELLCILVEAREAHDGDKRLAPYGIAANRKALEMVSRFAARQKIIPRAYSVDELFEPEVRRICAEVLGERA